ncbi:hypothetical protein C8Q80DRAFT_1058481, partial [Daedaleopsis nitida]
LSEEKFLSVLREHRPIVITGLQEHFQLPWTPEFFIEQFGDAVCDVEDCESGIVTPQTISQFFSSFGKPWTSSRKPLKLKARSFSFTRHDWPPRDNLREVFPQMQQEFERCVPLPAFTTPTGSKNLAAHFPENSVMPDLGPKLYCALCSVQDEEHSGSTRLHLDMSDAINILTYASLTRDGSRGFALWHIFAPEDTGSIRSYLAGRQDPQSVASGDPIHNQEHYLTPNMLYELEVRYRVRPYKIRQCAGQAVLIPAGCAHQVSNAADCVKIACDFISQESVSICRTLSEEFREQRLVRHWPPDVIPFASMLYYTWTSATFLRNIVAPTGC